MKKILMGATVVASLIATQASASDMYIGLDIINSGNTFTVDVNTLGSANVDDDSKAFKLKVGTVSNEGWRFQGYYLRETYDIPVFDASNDVLNEVGFDIIKGFEVTPEFSPFIQAGLGFGWMDVTGYTEDSIYAYNLKVGGGVMYKVVPQVELIAGIDFQYREWQDISAGSYTISTTEKSTKLYAGINYHF